MSESAEPDDVMTYRAVLVESEINAGGFARIQACWVEDRRVMFSTIVHHSQLKALENGMLFRVRNGAIVGGPEPLAAPG